MLQKKCTVSMKTNNDLSFLDNTNHPDVIKGHIRHITGTIRDKLNRYTVESILLTGSASYGGIGVIRLNECFIPYGDYDFAILCKKTPSPEIIDELRWRMNKDLFGGTDPTRGPLIDISVYNSKKRIRLNCDLSSYDSLETYKVLWGKDIFSNCRLRIEDVPPVSSFRLLMNRFSHLVISFSEEFLSRTPNKNELIDIEKNILKTYIEIGGAIALLNNRYHTNLNDRLQTFNINNPLKSFTKEEYQKLIEKIKYVTDKKLHPEESIYPDWHKERTIAGNYVLKIVPLLLQEITDSFINKNQIQDFVVQSMPKYYFSPYLQYEIKQRTGLSLPKHLLNLCSIGANIYERFLFSRKFACIKTGLTKWQSPILIYYWIIIHLFNCSTDSRKCRIDTIFISRLKQEMKEKNNIVSWEDIRTIAKNIWDNYAGRRW